MSPTEPAASPRQLTAIRSGVAASWAVGLGLIPLGLGFGIVITQAGYAWWWAPIFSVLIYAGSMEFLAIALFAGATGPLSLAVTALTVNFRHIFYGLSFPLSAISSPLGKAYGVYALTDEAYAIAATLPLSHRRSTTILTIQLVCQLTWVTSGVIGALAATSLSLNLAGAEFALTALFVALAVEAYRSSRDHVAAGLSVVCALIGFVIAPDAMLVIGLSLFVAALLIRYALTQRGGQR